MRGYALLSMLLPLLPATLTAAAAPPPPWAVFAPPAVAVGAAPAPAADVWSPGEIDPDYITTPAGCHPTATAEDVDRLMRGEIGPVKGHDSPRATPLGDGRTLWILQDAFLDYDVVPSQMIEMRYVNNVVMIQDAVGCFTVVARGDREWAASFEPGTDPENTWAQFWWPAGATAASGSLQVLWIEMTRDPYEGRPPLSGPAIHPVATWLGTYDLNTLERLTFAPAPEPGVDPIIGFDAVDYPAVGFTYLFGNTFLQNMLLDPVPPLAAHSATVTWLGRVPIGRLDLPAEHWTGDGWSTDPESATPIAQAGNMERIMRPRLIDGVWWSVTMPEGFLAEVVVVETAEGPQGPWTTFSEIRVTAHHTEGAIAGVLTYAPMLTPWADQAGRPIVVVSQIEDRWEENDGGDPNRYRPQALPVPPGHPPTRG